ncbi:MAG: anti-sigma factor family protein, partial [Alphaproteobacteria bacterium]
MDCRQIDRLLEANLEGRLSGFERMTLRQHLKTCRACRAKVDAMTAFSERVEKTLAGAEGPDWRRLAPPAATTSAAPAVGAVAGAGRVGR